MLDLRQVFSLTDFLRNHKELISRFTETRKPVMHETLPPRKRLDQRDFMEACHLMRRELAAMQDELRTRSSRTFRGLSEQRFE